MHIVTQTFHTAHFTSRDAAELCVAMDNLCRENEIDLSEFPALDNLFGAIAYIAEEQTGHKVVDELNDPSLLDDQAEPPIGAPDAEG